MPRTASRAITAVNRAATKKSASSPKTRTQRSALRGDASVGGTGTWHSARYLGPAGNRDYFVYVPRGLRSKQVPMVLALHGCTQTATEFAAATRFNQLADRHSFVVVYPEQATSANSQRCWNWFRAAHQQRGAGEPAILAGIVGRVIEQTQSWRIDPDRVYLTGLSAGGGMSVVLGAAYPDLFAAVGVHSAPPYRSATKAFDAASAMAARSSPPAPPDPLTSAPMPPMIVFQGSRDRVVSPVNAQRLSEQWLAHHRLSGEPGARSQIVRSTLVNHAPGSPSTSRSRRGHRVTRWYTGDGGRDLEIWYVDGLGHAWSGGAAHASYSDPRGPRASTEMWRFFAAHRLGHTGSQLTTRRTGSVIA